MANYRSVPFPAKLPHPAGMDDTPHSLRPPVAGFFCIRCRQNVSSAAAWDSNGRRISLHPATEREVDTVRHQLLPRNSAAALDYLTSFANTTKGVLPLPFFTLPRSSSSSSRTSWMKPSSSRVLRTCEMNREYLR